MLRIAGLQMQVSAEIEQNKARILAGLQQAALSRADFLVTPEGSLSGYTAQFDSEELLVALREVEVVARQQSVGLFLGTCYADIQESQTEIYNQMRVYAPTGEFLGAHAKILRCSPLGQPGSGEMADYAEGPLQTFTWKGIRLGALVCNDLWATPGYTTLPNPYLPWQLKQMGAQVIVHAINSGAEPRYRAFHESSAELWAYALGLPIVEVSAAQGNASVNAQSGWVDRDGQRVVRVPEVGEQFFICEIDI